jgi:hypothetical protein
VSERSGSAARGKTADRSFLPGGRIRKRCCLHLQQTIRRFLLLIFELHPSLPVFVPESQ